MVRSAAAVLAVLILPSFAQAQEPVGTHTVVIDDTLWDLAVRYYEDPFEWRVIWNANQDVVEDPHWIYPAEVLVIPGLPADPMDPGDPETGDPVEPGPEPDPGAVPPDLVPFGLRQARPITEGARTIFFEDSEGTRQLVEASRAREYLAVSPDAVYSAPWLIRLGQEPESEGYVEGFADRTERASTMRSFSRIRISMPAPARVGANLQIFRMGRTIEDVGHVVVPTGVATVSTIGSGEVVAIVTKEYERIQPGDLVRPLPTYDPVAGNYAEEISGGSEAMIMGFAGSATLTSTGHIAFLDLGSDDGVMIGDEFVLYGRAIPTVRRGSLQVIGVTETMASARVTSIEDDVFRQGVVVRMAKKMR